METNDQRFDPAFFFILNTVFKVKRQQSNTRWIFKFSFQFWEDNTISMSHLAVFRIYIQKGCECIKK